MDFELIVSGPEQINMKSLSLDYVHLIVFHEQNQKQKKFHHSHNWELPKYCTVQIRQ